MSDVLGIYDALHDVFDVAKEALATTVGGLPECAYVAPGTPAWDACPCLIVYSGGPSVGDTFPLQPALASLHRIATTGMVNLVTLNVLSLRCAPLIDDNGILPTPADQDAAAKEVYSDVWALWNWFAAKKRDLTLFPPKEREFSLDPGILVNPQGGAAGSIISIRTQLDGYTP